MTSHTNNLSTFNERGSIVGLLALLVVIVLGATSVFFFLFGQVVPPNRIGIRQNHFSVLGLVKEGYGSKGLPPGLHWQVPGVSRVLLLPRDFQIVNFDAEKQQGDLDLADLNIQTTDGSKVSVDVSLIVRLKEHPVTVEQPVAPAVKQEGHAVPDAEPVPFAAAKERKYGGPSELIRNFSVDKTRQLTTLAVNAQSDLNQALSVLSTTDFYSPSKREKATIRANETLNESVNPVGIESWGTLIRRYRYLDGKIDDQIFAKNLQDQTEHLNAALSRLAEAKAETERKRAFWDAKIRTLEVEGESKVKVIRSEGDLAEARKTADGNLLVAEARAKVDGAKATALTDVAGAEVYVAREMSPIIATLQGGVVTGIDPFDVDAWVERLTPKGVPK